MQHHSEVSKLKKIVFFSSTLIRGGKVTKWGDFTRGWLHHYSRRRALTLVVCTSVGIPYQWQRHKETINHTKTKTINTNKQFLVSSILLDVFNTCHWFCLISNANHITIYAGVQRPMDLGTSAGKKKKRENVGPRLGKNSHIFPFLASQDALEVIVSVSEWVRDSKNRVDWCDPGEWRYLLRTLLTRLW